MTIAKLKDYLHNTIIEDGYQLHYVNFQEHHLDKLIELCQEAKKDLYNNCHVERINSLLLLTAIVNSSVLDWEEKYSICWKIKDSMFELTSFDWYDPDMDYEDDVRAFYQAAQDHIEGL